MSQQDNFLGGFFLGALFGGVVGGVVGVVVTNRLAKAEDLEGREPSPKKLEGKSGASGASLKDSRRQSASPQSIESARRGLEDKIAQLNDAIDDVRQKLGSMNGVPKSDVGTQTTAERKD